MVLAVLLQHYRCLIFECLRSTQLFRNQFISTYLYIADSILLLLCYYKLGFQRFWRCCRRCFLLLSIVDNKLLYRFLFFRGKLVQNSSLCQFGNCKCIVFKGFFCSLEYCLLIYSTFYFFVFLVILDIFFSLETFFLGLLKVLFLFTR